MNNNEIGKLKTFHQLLEEENSIIIPKVQRDYAYGRNDEKVANVLNGMLTSILLSVRDDNTNILDFVYGGSYIKKNKVVAGLIPLDGQQRLTTLFLLHFYASLLGDEDGKEICSDEVSELLKFRYETRQSATEFCKKLIINIRTDLLKSYNPANDKIKDLIIDNAQFLSTYRNDPTIESMLNVLEKIENKCKELNVLDLTPCLWRRLWDRKNIQFYKLSLENFGLTDDLFIKMNARGKKLTDFEIFKSDMMAAIKSVSESLKDEFSNKMDTEWIDIAWDYTDKTINNNRKAIDITNEADIKYSVLFQNIFKLEYYRREMSALGINEATIDILKDEESIKSVMDMFDTLYKIHKQGFNDYWYNYFYFDDNVIGKDDKIRLFWRQKRNSVFEISLNGALTVSEMVYFYAAYLLFNKNYEDYITKRCFRIIHNLMTGNVRAGDARTDKLSGFLTEVKYIVDHKGIDTYYDKNTELIIDGNVHKLAFIQNVWNEEFIKQNCLCEDSYLSLMRYENHDILRCSLSLFMDYTLYTDELNSNVVCRKFDATPLLNLLAKFENLFGNDFYSHFNLIRTLLLDSQVEYMQYDPYMNRNDKRRYFLTTPYHLSEFFIKNNVRKDQFNILTILENITIPNDYNVIYNYYDNFGVRDWQYYMAKYNDCCFRDSTRYGICVWDNNAEYPLDLILLNSSQHSSSNLEWMMLNNILWNKLNDRNLYYLDDHGCSAILLTQSASSIGFSKGKWNIETELDLVPLIQSSHSDWIISREDKIISIDMKHGEENMDYIEMGLEIVSIINSIKAVQ